MIDDRFDTCAQLATFAYKRKNDYIPQAIFIIGKEKNLCR